MKRFFEIAIPLSCIFIVGMVTFVPVVTVARFGFVLKTIKGENHGKKRCTTKKWRR